MHRITRIKVTEMNQHLMCILCGGYLVDATTIIECLHSFCRTCILKYLESSKYCPICDVQVHKTRPYLNIRSDKTLQALVYKLVPGLFQNEMKRRRDFYAENGDRASTSSADGEERGEVPDMFTLCTEDEQISLCLQHFEKLPPYRKHYHVKGQPPDTGSDKRYLLCPAAVAIRHLKKFVRMKFDLTPNYKIEIFHSNEPLEDEYTLMDIAHIYSWRRKEPLKLFYFVYDEKDLPAESPAVVAPPARVSPVAARNPSSSLHEPQHATVRKKAGRKPGRKRKKSLSRSPPAVPLKKSAEEGVESTAAENVDQKTVLEPASAVPENKEKSPSVEESPPLPVEEKHAEKTLPITSVEITGNQPTSVILTCPKSTMANTETVINNKDDDKVTIESSNKAVSGNLSDSNSKTVDENIPLSDLAKGQSEKGVCGVPIPYEGPVFQSQNSQEIINRKIAEYEFEPSMTIPNLPNAVIKGKRPYASNDSLGINMQINANSDNKKPRGKPGRKPKDPSEKRRGRPKRAETVRSLLEKKAVLERQAKEQQAGEQHVEDPAVVGPVVSSVGLVATAVQPSLHNVEGPSPKPSPAVVQEVSQKPDKHVQPKTLQPKPVQPRSVQPKPVQPKTVQPSPAQPKTVQPKPVQLNTVQSVPVQPKTLQPKPVQPKTVQPKPLQPKPVQPKSAQPKVVQTKPVQPKPAQKTSEVLKVSVPLKSIQKEAQTDLRLHSPTPLSSIVVDGMKAKTEQAAEPTASASETVIESKSCDRPQSPARQPLSDNEEPPKSGTEKMCNEGESSSVSSPASISNAGSPHSPTSPESGLSVRVSGTPSPSQRSPGSHNGSSSGYRRGNKRTESIDQIADTLRKKAKTVNGKGSVVAGSTLVNGDTPNGPKVISTNANNNLTTSHCANTTPVIKCSSVSNPPTNGSPEAADDYRTPAKGEKGVGDISPASSSPDDPADNIPLSLVARGYDQPLELTTKKKANGDIKRDSVPLRIPHLVKLC